MKVLFLVLQLIFALSLIGLILLQSSQGGLGSAWGGELYRTKRGAEKFVFTATIVTATLFLFVSILNLVVR